MVIQQIAEKIQGELSGYELSGYIEVCAPVFKRTLSCLMAGKGELPIVTEFVLNYYALKVPLDDIPLILGIDKDLVMDAWWDLIHKDLIDYRSKKVTEIGHNYLEERKLEKFEEISVFVCVDGLIGTIKMDTPQLMKNRSVRENGLKGLRPVIGNIYENNIDFNQVKKVINSYKKIDEEYYEGDLLDVVKVEGNKTFYKRLHVIFYSNKVDHTRISVYESGERVDEYEKALLTLESIGNSILKPIEQTYPDINFVTELGLQKDEVGPGTIFNNWIDLIRNATSEIIISLPMIELYSPDDLWIDLLSEANKRGVRIVVIASGREFCSTYQKEQYTKLLKLFNTNYCITQVPCTWSRLIIVDQKTGIVSQLERHKIYLPSTKEGYVEKGYVIDKNQIDSLMRSYVHPGMDNIKTLVPKLINKEWLTYSLRDITRMVNDYDEILKVKNSVGWLGDYPIPNINNIDHAPLAVNEDTFKQFINAMNQSFSESVDFTGKSNNLKRYFWGDFKLLAPRIQRVLHKIRMYRNLANHLKIDDEYKTTFYQYLDEDLLGRLPQFVPNGYLYLQEKIVKDFSLELSDALK